ncbi:unnamed protein product [Leuciscus chuanchicus]
MCCPPSSATPAEQHITPISHPPSLQAYSRNSPQSAEHTCGAALVIKRYHQGHNISFSYLYSPQYLPPHTDASVSVCCKVIM